MTTTDELYSSRCFRSGACAAAAGGRRVRLLLPGSVGLPGRQANAAPLQAIVPHRDHGCLVAGPLLRPDLPVGSGYATLVASR